MHGGQPQRKKERNLGYLYMFFPLWPQTAGIELKKIEEEEDEDQVRCVFFDWLCWWVSLSEKASLIFLLLSLPSLVSSLFRISCSQKAIHHHPYHHMDSFCCLSEVTKKKNEHCWVSHRVCLSFVKLLSYFQCLNAIALNFSAVYCAYRTWFFWEQFLSFYSFGLSLALWTWSRTIQSWQSGLLNVTSMHVLYCTFHCTCWVPWP